MRTNNFYHLLRRQMVHDSKSEFSNNICYAFTHDQRTQNLPCLCTRNNLHEPTFRLPDRHPAVRSRSPTICKPVASICRTMPLPVWVEPATKTFGPSGDGHEGSSSGTCCSRNGFCRSSWSMPR